jgi:hypothetical protein
MNEQRSVRRTSTLYAQDGCGTLRDMRDLHTLVSASLAHQQRHAQTLFARTPSVRWMRRVASDLFNV